MTQTQRRRTHRQRRMSGDAILTLLAVAMALPVLVLSQMAIWESERILSEGIPEPPRTAYVFEMPAPTAEVTIQRAKPTPAPAPSVNERYAGITMSDEERRELLAVIYLEAANQSAEGQQSVAERGEHTAYGRGFLFEEGRKQSGIQHNRRPRFLLRLRMVRDYERPRNSHKGNHARLPV